MKKIIKDILKINLYFFTGMIIVDAYNKICDIHRFEKTFIEVATEVMENSNKETED